MTQAAFSGFIYILALLPFYLIGAYPTGYLIAKNQGFDIAHSGSGNVGATNISRFLGLKAGAWTLLGDISKGIISMLIALFFSRNATFQALCATATVAGHCFSIPGKLKGGKGVATSFGVFLLLQPYSALTGLLVFVVSLSIWKIVSVASLLAVFSAPLLSLVLGANEITVSCMMVIFLIVLFRHKSNLKRLILGTEEKFKTLTPKEN